MVQEDVVKKIMMVIAITFTSIMVVIFALSIGYVFNTIQIKSNLVDLELRIINLENRGISICKGCGAEYYTDGFVKYHDECPQCPVSEEQLDDWIKQLENAKCKVCYDAKKIIHKDGTERPCPECSHD